jgi:hypothetical protein
MICFMFMVALGGKNSDIARERCSLCSKCGGLHILRESRSIPPYHTSLYVDGHCCPNMLRMSERFFLTHVYCL